LRNRAAGKRKVKSRVKEFLTGKTQKGSKNNDEEKEYEGGDCLK